MLDKFKDLSQNVAKKAAEGASKAAAGVQKARGKSKGADDQYIVALDVGTEFVKALIARVVNGDEAEIIRVGRQHQSLSDMQAGAIADIASVVENCDKALNQAEEQAGVAARTAMIGIAG